MANDNTIIRPATPKYGINEVVYLKESALLGYLESVKVQAIRFNSEFRINMYTFVFKKSNKLNQIAGDAIDLRRSVKIELPENDLLSLQEALEIKITFLRNELKQAEDLRSKRFPSI